MLFIFGSCGVVDDQLVDVELVENVRLAGWTLRVDKLFARLKHLIEFVHVKWFA